MLERHRTSTIAIASSLRGQLLFEPNDALSVRLIGDYTKRDESCCGAVHAELREEFDPTPGVPGDFDTAASNRIVNILRALFRRNPSIGDDPFNRNIAITPGRTYRNDIKDWGLSGEIDYDFGGAELTSITAYRDYKSKARATSTSTISTSCTATTTATRSAASRPSPRNCGFRVDAFDDKLDWLVGGYFAHEKLRVSDNIRFGTQYGPFAACRALPARPWLPRQSWAFSILSLPGCLSPTGRAIIQGLVPRGRPRLSARRRLSSSRRSTA